MKTLLPALLLLVFPVSALAQRAGDIPPPARRAATLEQARALLTAKSAEGIEAEAVLKNPFNPAKPEPVADASSSAPVAVARVGDRERLESIAPLVQPSGTMQLGDVSILLFGQKKFKVGDRLPIVFEGVTYELQISVIDRTSFGLRLNNEEITQPIKPVAPKP